MGFPRFLRAGSFGHAFQQSTVYMRKMLLGMHMRHLRKIKKLDLLTPHLVPKPKLRKGDKVQIVGGPHIGQRGEVVSIYRRSGRITVAGVNMVNRTLKTEAIGVPMKMPSPILYKHVNVIDPVLDIPTRIRYARAPSGKRIRIAVKSGAFLKSNKKQRILKHASQLTWTDKNSYKTSSGLDAREKTFVVDTVPFHAAIVKSIGAHLRHVEQGLHAAQQTSEASTSATSSPFKLSPEATMRLAKRLPVAAASVASQREPMNAPRLPARKRPSASSAKPSPRDSSSLPRL
ncbi:hypothetical protein CAOG_06946 [Capsaspora owczarzaki ATCC 30864]|uniref:KOW domain-containing protein n=1 Tax=Capsaspora owczarzaki (strain ATCC 30864) TaxID=595528 RepID=A0A0D2UNX7_CAPO3|nr:hypothetical protein CAOG_06946 [Capsaspora owczarzaki ATCC 30864]KJE96656.1 hypothetical protein CAOG_006946 [Capsaspora owczarzaki ATCC 30864]|eukprot:XP_004343670.1 hypothetical protein CAOG_06946 [Capsaspora owczarzaki ATCC 30864]